MIQPGPQFRSRLRQLQAMLMTLAVLPSRLLPGCCALCGAAASSAVCAACRRLAASGTADGAGAEFGAAGGISHASAHCRQCACAVTPPALLCGRCLTHPPAFDASFAATRYAPPVDLLVQALKFRAQLPLAQAFAQWLLESLPGTLPEGSDRQVDAALPNQGALAVAGDLLIAVPLSAERLAERGFNQAQEIARPLARALRLPLISETCVRVRDTLPQSGLALADRRDNMRGAFAVIHRQAIAGKRVLVVDDVMTTGHTLDALAACLKRHGAASVTNLVFARTPPR